MNETEEITYEDGYEEEALSVLLKDGVCFISSREYIAPFDEHEKTIAVVVNCNDTFYWGTSDTEPLPHSEIFHLYDMHIKDKEYGSTEWCCMRRSLRPHIPLVEQMKRAGAWDEELEALPAPEPL